MLTTCSIFLSSLFRPSIKAINARKKLKQKNLDWIVANDVSKTNQGFSSDQNAVTLISSNGLEKQIYLADKSIVAKEILHAIHLSWLEKAH